MIKTAKFEILIKVKSIAEYRRVYREIKKAVHPFPGWTNIHGGILKE
jgi:hypothetical protein